MRKKLNIEEKKVNVCLTINPTIMKVINKHYSNKSKYIEHVLYQDLLNKNQIENDLLF